MGDHGFSEVPGREVSEPGIRVTEDGKIELAAPTSYKRDTTGKTRSQTADDVRAGYKKAEYVAGRFEATRNSLNKTLAKSVKAETEADARFQELLRTDPDKKLKATRDAERNLINRQRNRAAAEQAIPNGKMSSAEVNAFLRKNLKQDIKTLKQKLTAPKDQDRKLPGKDLLTSQALSRALQRASEFAFPDRPIQSKSAAETASIFDGYAPEEQTVLFERMSEEIVDMIVYGEDSTGSGTDTSPFHDAAEGILAVGSADKPLRRVIFRTYEKVAAADDRLRFQRGIGRYLRDDTFINASPGDDLTWAKKIHDELGIGPAGAGLYNDIVEQPLSIARPEAGGRPGVSLALNRARSPERIKAIEGARDRLLKFYEDSLTEDGDLQHWQRAALEHSEFGALLDMGYHEISQDTKISPNQPDNPVVITTAGRAVCCLCVGEPSEKSGIAEIITAYGRNSLVIQSLPLRDETPFSSRWLNRVDGVDGQVATKVKIDINSTTRTYTISILETENKDSK